MDYPKTRMDNFFAKAAGSELADNSMEPITDREYWINELAARLAEGGLVPAIEEGDEGKVLTASDGAAVWSEGGGGEGAIYIDFNADEMKLDASFNELLEYYNEGKLIFFKEFFDEEGETRYTPFMLTQMKRISYDQSLTFYAYFTAFPFYDGGVQPFAMPFISTDADEKMVFED